MALPWWRAFRIALAFTALFHLGVFLVMNISFAHNIVVYGAFVPWAVRLPAARVLLVAPVIAAAAWLLVPGEVTAAVILFTGGVFGAGYLAGQLWSMCRLTRSEA